MPRNFIASQAHRQTEHIRWTGPCPYESPLKRLWAFLIDYSLLLVTGALAALLWANVSPDSYTPMAHLLHFVVNGVGMVFFFAIGASVLTYRSMR